jgi:hypothetical protein
MTKGYKAFMQLRGFMTVEQTTLYWFEAGRCLT